MVKLVIFDFDGVIITGSNEGYFTCYHKTLEEVGILLDPAEEREKILENWGKGYKLQLEYLLKKHLDLLPQAIQVYEKYYYSPLFFRNIRLVKGADITLRQLAKKYTLAIASGMMRKTLDTFSEKFAIADVFQKIITSDEIQNPEDKKPAPYILNKLLDYFSIDKREAAYVGDAANDVKMAKNAGIKPIVVLTGHLTKDEAEKLKVKHIIPDITYLLDTL